MAATTDLSPLGQFLEEQFKQAWKFFKEDSFDEVRHLYHGLMLARFEQEPKTSFRPTSSASGCFRSLLSVICTRLVFISSSLTHQMSMSSTPKKPSVCTRLFTAPARP